MKQANWSGAGRMDLGRPLRHRAAVGSRGQPQGRVWGSRILQAAEIEARRRGCDRVAVSSFTFQAPGFYQRHGYAETGRTLGIPGGYADVHLFKSLIGSTPSCQS